MDIQVILNTYDSMFGHYSLNEIEIFLKDHIDKARQLQLKDIEFTLLNEMIGFMRDTTQRDKGIDYCKQLLHVLEELNIQYTVEYATCLLNVANAYRAFALYDDSLFLFKQCESIYEGLLSSNDFNWANLYNNYGLLFQEIKQYQLSVDTLLKALKVVDTYKDALIPQAITRTNLAVSLVQLMDDESYRKAKGFLEEALKLFENHKDDFHYNAALVAYGDLMMYKNDYREASSYYRLGLVELEKHVGKNDNYLRVKDKYEYALSLCKKSNLELSYDYYMNKVKPLLMKEFKDDYPRMAIGMVGEGSDCYGFDDDISKDHDLDIGFCIWLNNEDYNKIGNKLNDFYESLSLHHGLLKNRRGVFNINDFYNSLLETECDFEGNGKIDLSLIDEYKLSVCTNGLVFEDGLGLFSKIRNQLLDYYPDKLWREKIANVLHYYSQYAQCNYERMIKRNDFISASLCKIKAIEVTMDFVYLLNRRYAPYYKWKRKGLENMSLGQSIISILDELVNLDIDNSGKTIELFELIADVFRKELIRLNLISGDDLFLETYIQQVLNDDYKDIIERIIKIEWSMFDKVENVGGRASCQNNYPVFYIMRKSQYLSWNKALLESYLNDLIEAEKKGWNIITEKYARMMESTNPKEYELLKEHLSTIDDDRKKIQEEIIKVQVMWMEQFKELYPKMASQARIINTSEDSSDDTSYETYLRGELSTYSSKTLSLYGYMIVDMLNNKQNLAYNIMSYTAKLYGYKSIDDAEKSL